MKNNNEIILETENILIKKIQKTDFRNFLSLHQSPISMKYFDGGVKTLEQSRIRFKEIMEHQQRFGFSYYNLFLKTTSEYIGQAGLYYNYDMSVNLCYALLEQFHGNGYASEAIEEILKDGFTRLHLSSISAMSCPENINSIHILEKFGAKFNVEKILFSGIKAKCYVITKEDFYNILPLIKKYKYRKAVGVILIDKNGFIYTFQRKDFPTNWQSPEGGIEENEEPIDTAYREINEEIGISKDKLKLITETKFYYRYNYINNEIKYGYIGQEKKFFLFRFLGDELDFFYNSTTEKQEFINFKLISKNNVINLVSDFKKNTYKSVLNEFDEYLK